MSEPDFRAVAVDIVMDGPVVFGAKAAEHYMAVIEDALRAAYARGHADGMEDAAKLMDARALIYANNYSTARLDADKQQYHFAQRACQIGADEIRQLSRLPGGEEGE